MAAVPNRRQRGSIKDPNVFLRKMLRKVGRLAYVRVKPTIPSKTLRAALELVMDITDEDHQAFLYIPHYWAVYYHDGRGSMRKRNNYRQRGYFVWYLNPKDDPRLRGGYPVREGGIKRLTKEQFYADLAENYRRRIFGEPPKMVVTPYVGGATGYPFFEDLDIYAEASKLIRNQFSDWVVSQVPTDRDTATINLRF